MSQVNRRVFLSSAAMASLGAAAMRAGAQGAAAESRAEPQRPGMRFGSPRAPLAISSANGLRTVERAVELMRGGADPVDAIVEGVAIVEDDPADNSVGLGGLPNERGIVELDASVMHGPTHKAGAVAALQHIRNPAKVALEVLRRTDHVLLVGEGALAFARTMGFQEENLLTPASREAWLKWKANLNPGDDLLDDHQRKDYEGKTGQEGGDGAAPPRQMSQTNKNSPLTWGTIHCAAVNAAGDLGACTSTSGLSFKLPGRVGDSPIVGAGLFVDNAVGSAGATGRGEAVIQSCGAFQAVRHMAEGIDPTEACLLVLKWIADHTRGSLLLDDRGQPNFDVTLYALRKDGKYGSATMRAGGKFAVHDGAASRLIDCEFMFERQRPE